MPSSPLCQSKPPPPCTCRSMNPGTMYGPLGRSPATAASPRDLRDLAIRRYPTRRDNQPVGVSIAPSSLVASLPSWAWLHSFAEQAARARSGARPVATRKQPVSASPWDRESGRRRAAKASAAKARRGRRRHIEALSATGDHADGRRQMFDRAIADAHRHRVARVGLLAAPAARTKRNGAVRDRASQPARIASSAAELPPTPPRSAHREATTPSSAAKQWRTAFWPDPAAAAAISGEPAPGVALDRKPVGEQTMPGDAGADDDEAAGRAGPRPDQRRIAVAHQAGSRERRERGQELRADLQIGSGGARRKHDAGKVVRWDARSPRQHCRHRPRDARQRQLEIGRGIAGAVLGVRERCGLRDQTNARGCACRRRRRRNRALRSLFRRSPTAEITR